MRLFFVTITGFILALAGAATAEPFIYPKADQSKEQQGKDKYECHGWAVEQTGFDPMNVAAAPAPTEAPKGGAVRGAARGAAVGAAVGAIAGDAGKGAAIGAAGGGLGGAMRRRDQGRDQQYSEDQHKAAIDAKRADYDRAFKTCLEARDYTVN